MTLTLMNLLSSNMLAAGASAMPLSNGPVNEIEIEGYSFVEIPGGPFVRGSVEFGELSWIEQPSFWMGKRLVSADQYRSRALISNPEVRGLIHYLQKDEPIGYVNWDDASDYLRELSQETETTMTLPSSDQWEYAARGFPMNVSKLMQKKREELIFCRKNEQDFIDDFTEWLVRHFENFVTRLGFGARIFNVRDDGLQGFQELQELLLNEPEVFAWHIYATPSGGFPPKDEIRFNRNTVSWDYSGPPNTYGLEDMIGGPWEWVLDSHENVLPGFEDCPHRVLRGGSWTTDREYLRAAHYFHYQSNAREGGFSFRPVVKL